MSDKVAIGIIGTQPFLKKIEMLSSMQRKNEILENHSNSRYIDELR